MELYLLQGQYRVPPPSPVAGTISPTNEVDELAEFLNRSICVPELILPDRVFHRLPVVINPPVIDFALLINEKSVVDELKLEAASIGCFQVVNHGFPEKLIAAAEVAAAEVFYLSLEKKKDVAPERCWDFELESHSDGEEFFVWTKKKQNGTAETLLHSLIKESSDVLDILYVEMEKVANRIGEMILANSESCNQRSTRATSEMHGCSSSVLILHKHVVSEKVDGGKIFLRMLANSSKISYFTSLHICATPASAFHVYSDRGWMAFEPKDKILVVTAWSDGQHEYAIGKPIFFNHDCNHEDQGPISFTFLLCSSHPTKTTEKSISLSQQIIIAACLVFLYHLLVYLYRSF